MPLPATAGFSDLPALNFAMKHRKFSQQKYIEPVYYEKFLTQL